MSELQVSPGTAGEVGWVTSTLTPSLRARAIDPEGRSATISFELEHDPEYGSSGSIWAGTAANVPSGYVASATVPTGRLVDLQHLRWRARASVGTAAGAWSD
ncbi:hypothetical protein, partial [Nonomuraea basaltis]|uniref:hypothetical protein n=1 Tax=Nonomuraea basaltis TaxID=2495887 RepID=UPI00197FCBDE